MDSYQSYYANSQYQCNTCPIQSEAAYVYIPTRPIVNISYTNITTLATVVPSGGQSLPLTVVILPGSSILPISTLTIISGWSDLARNNNLDLYPINGVFLISYAGIYNIVVNLQFTMPMTVAPGDFREAGIYKITRQSGLVSLLALCTQPAIASTPSVINLVSNVSLEAADRIFIAVRQSNASMLGIDVMAGTKLSMERI